MRVPKSISIPILRRKVAARRSRPESARAFTGHVLALAMRSSAASERLLSKSEAVPVHTDARPWIRARPSPPDRPRSPLRPLRRDWHKRLAEVPVGHSAGSQAEAHSAIARTEFSQDCYDFARLCAMRQRAKCEHGLDAFSAAVPTAVVLRFSFEKRPLGPPAAGRFLFLQVLLARLLLPPATLFSPLDTHCDLLLLPVNEFILKPAHRARAERHGRGKCAGGNAFVDCAPLFPCNCLHFRQPKDAAEKALLFVAGFSRGSRSSVSETDMLRLH